MAGERERLQKKVRARPETCWAQMTPSVAAGPEECLTVLDSQISPK